MDVTGSVRRRRKAPTAAGVFRRVVVVQAVLLGLLAVLATAAVLTYRVADASARRSEDVLVTLGALRAEVLSAETSLRGFVLVENDTFLVPYREAFPATADAVDQLEERIEVDGTDRLIAIEETFGGWREQFAEVVLADLAAGRRDEAIELMESGAGKQRIDLIRLNIDYLEARTRSELEDRRGAADQRGIIGLALAVVVLGALVSTVYASRRRLERDVGAPLLALVEVADRFGAGDLAVRATPVGVVEVQRLAAAFNAMGSRTEATVSDLRAVDRLKSEFVSVVSHELRTPLTSIRGSLGLVSSGVMGELPPEVADMLTIAVSNTDRLVRLINDILDLERIEAGDDALELRPCAISGITKAAAEAVAGAAHDAGVTLDVRPADEWVHGDGDRLVQALTNLLGNAVKFSEAGQSVVVDTVPRGDRLVVRVRDEGRGIPADRLEEIFEPFAQVDASDAREKGGTGLGLAIVRSIVSRHGGRVEVDSVPGEGSTFALVLPLSRASSPEQQEPPAPGTAVLLVEDDLDLRDVIRAGLGRHGVGVTTASTASEAIERCRTSPPDVLVLDVQLGEGSGYEVVRELRQHDHLRNLATIVYTVSDLTPEQRDGLRLGDTVFVTKGQRSNEDLEREVLDVLSRSRPAG